MHYFEMKNSTILWEGAWGGAMHYALCTVLWGAEEVWRKHPSPHLSFLAPQFSCLRHSNPTAFFDKLNTDAKMLSKSCW